MSVSRGAHFSTLKQSQNAAQGLSTINFQGCQQSQHALAMTMRFLLSYNLLHHLWGMSM